MLPFDPAAIEVLWEVARRVGLGGDLTILSGYRTPQTNVAVHGAGDSQHLRAGAVDVMWRRAAAGFAEQALLLGRGGVGVYRRAASCTWTAARCGAGATAGELAGLPWWRPAGRGRS